MREKLNEKRLKESRAEEEKKRQEEEARRIEEEAKQQAALASVPPQQLPSPPLAAEEEEESSDDEEAELQARKLRTVWSKLKWDPRTDVKERTDAYVIRVLLPGMTRKQVDIDLERGRALRIRGTKAPTLDELKSLREEIRNLGYSDPTDQQVLQVASGRFGSFVLSWAIPEDVNLDRIAANFDKGQLVVTLPKAPRIARPNPWATADPWSSFGMW